MRTTIELPDALINQARSRAALRGISLKDFFIEAIEQALASEKENVPRPPPVIGSANGRRIGVLSTEQTDEAMFG